MNPRPFTHSSPSQIKTFRRCKARWWAEKIAGMVVPPTPATIYGQACHRKLENYLVDAVPIDGKEYVLERPIKGDFAIVRAWKADRWGNCVFRKTARNFSPLIAMAAKTTIVEAEHLVDVGTLDGDEIHLPSIFVKRVIQGTNYQKWIEQRTVRPRPA